MSKKILLAMCVIFTQASFSATTIKHPCNSMDSKTIVKAINNFLDSQNGLASKDVDILSKECVRNYAAAKVHPKKPVTDDAIVYLHKVKNKWEVMSMGTDFDKTLLSKLPKELRYQNQ